MFSDNQLVVLCTILCRDKMGLSLYPDTQRVYLEMLAEWAHPSHGRKSLALLSGDMHFAMKTDVKR